MQICVKFFHARLFSAVLQIDPGQKHRQRFRRQRQLCAITAHRPGEPALLQALREHPRSGAVKNRASSSGPGPC